jgi:hypothetical protein
MTAVPKPMGEVRMWFFLFIGEICENQACKAANPCFEMGCLSPIAILLLLRRFTLPMKTPLCLITGKEDFSFNLKNNNMKAANYYLLLVIMLAIGLSACSDSLTRKVESTTNEAGEIIGDIVEPNPSSVSIDDVRQWIADFDTVSGNHEFTHGFKLSVGDISALFEDKDTVNSDTIYAMIGYKAEIDSFDLIFCIETPTGSGVYKYFDFTKPCPSFCPNYPKPDTLPKVEALARTKGYWFGRDDMTNMLDSASEEGASLFLFLNPDSINIAEGIQVLFCNTTCEDIGHFARCDSVSCDTPPCNPPLCHQVPD